ncbi:amino acid ABC transporter substrate-binding protein [Caenispirillum bisanense]|uniref:amino acid ABC transporter substrate-binding protein n=1 Tax=Caenispirillum bisanense TaxID=414052 RepID=UPI0031DE3391
MQAHPLARLAAAVAIAAALAFSGGADAATAEAPASPPVPDTGTLAKVRDRGVLLCGVNEESGFAQRDASGRYVSLRADLCRAVAAAVLADGEAVTFVPLFSAARFKALAEGEIDVLLGGATWTLARESAFGIHFTGTNFFEGQGFIAHRNLGYRSLADVERAVVCVIAETTTVENLRAWIRSTGKDVKPVELVTSDGAWNAFLAHNCDLMTNDLAGMVMALRDRTPDPDDFVVFPDVISREPLSPAVRNNDPQWEAIIRFTVNAVILAEAKGVTAAAARARQETDDPEVRRLLGLDPGIGAPVGLDDDWARRIIAAVGHYGEIFDRNLGAGSRYKMERGLNALWTDGGLLYPLPIR